VGKGKFNEGHMAEVDVNQDMKAHSGTYSLFIGMMKYGSIVVAIVTLLVVLLIS
jgi:hypothetical protein